MLEDDGSILDDDVLDVLFSSTEKIGSLMFLKDGEDWKPGLYSSSCVLPTQC